MDMYILCCLHYLFDLIAYNYNIYLYVNFLNAMKHEVFNVWAHEKKFKCEDKVLVICNCLDSSVIAWTNLANQIIIVYKSMLYVLVSGSKYAILKLVTFCLLTSACVV